MYSKENNIILFKIGGVLHCFFGCQNEPVKSRELNLFTPQKLQRMDDMAAPFLKPENNIEIFT